MSRLNSLAAWRKGAALLALCGAATMAMAAPVWQEVNTLDSWLGQYGTESYSGDSSTRTGTVTYTGERATNTGSDARRLGFYLGWTWSWDRNAAGAWVDTPLAWNNVTQTFVGNGVTMKINRLDAPLQYLKLGDIVDDTWIGVPWDTGSGETPIATDANWVVPFFDFGVIGAGQFASYDISISLKFDDQAAYEHWNSSGSFYAGGQAVQAVPEPGSLALIGLSLVGLVLTRRRR